MPARRQKQSFCRGAWAFRSVIAAQQQQQPQPQQQPQQQQQQQQPQQITTILYSKDNGWKTAHSMFLVAILLQSTKQLGFSPEGPENV